MSNIESILQQYKLAAGSHGNALQIGDKKTANKQYTVLKNIYKALQKDTQLQNEVLKMLLLDSNHHISAWAAAHSLGLMIHIEDANRVLEELSLRKDIGIARLDAEMTLKAWKEKGTLTF